MEFIKTWEFCVRNRMAWILWKAVIKKWLPDTGILLTKHSNTLRLKHVNTLNNQNT